MPLLRHGTRRIAAGEFKQRCLQLMDEVRLRRMSLIITKRGKPVAKLVPVDDAPDSYGSMLGSVRYRGDIVAPDADVWEDRE